MKYTSKELHIIYEIYREQYSEEESLLKIQDKILENAARNVSFSFIPTKEKSELSTEKYYKDKQEKCDHRDVGTIGGVDVCKFCGKQW